LDLHGVLRRAEKIFDAQVLFGPFEEKLYLPPLFLKLCDGDTGQQKVVG